MPSENVHLTGNPSAYNGGADIEQNSDIPVNVRRFKLQGSIITPDTTGHCRRPLNRRRRATEYAAGTCAASARLVRR